MTGQWIRFAAAHQGAWGSAMSTTINKAEAGFWALSHTLKKSWPKVSTDTPGAQVAGDMIAGQANVSGQITCRWSYRGAVPFLMLRAMAAESFSGASNPWTHASNFPGASGLIGRNISIAWREIATGGASPTYRYYEIPNAKVWGWTLRGTVPGFLDIVFDVIGDDIVRPATAVSDLGTVVNPNHDEHQAMTGDIFSINQHGSAVASASVNQIELSYQWPHVGHHVTGSSALITEPIDTGPVNITLKTTRPTKDDNSFERAYDQNPASGSDLYEAELRWAGNDSAELQIDLPKLEIVDQDAPFSGPAEVPETVTFKALDDFDTGANMSTTDPIKVSVLNGWNADYATAWP